jgi:hypothetical protein
MERHYHQFMTDYDRQACLLMVQDDHSFFCIPLHVKC